MKLVSIIVPVYNRGMEVSKCYQSLIQQTYKNMEILFVNDGSTDNTLNVLHGFSDKRVKIINQENKGPAEARRVGVEKSRGDYICFVDSDDTINRSFIYKLVRSIERNHSNMAVGRIGVHYYYPFVKFIPLKSRRKPKFIDLEEKREYLPALSPMLIGKLFKREYLLLQKLDFLANEDIAQIYPMYVRCRYIAVANDAVYHYQLAETSQFKQYLLGYHFVNLANTFGPLHYIYQQFMEMDQLEDYFYEIEMLFIKNISERIWNIKTSVDDKIYRYKFISVLLDYLEYFFPDWDKNPYYVRGYKLGEVSDIFHIRRAYNEISKLHRKKLCLELEQIYDRYKQVEKMYDNSK